MRLASIAPFVVLVFFTGIRSCEAQRAFDPTTDNIARKSNNEIILAISEETLEKAIKMANRNIKTLTASEFTTLSDPATEDIVPYLMVSTKLTDGGCFLIALNLSENEAGYICRRRWKGNVYRLLLF